MKLMPRSLSIKVQRWGRTYPLARPSKLVTSHPNFHLVTFKREVKMQVTIQSSTKLNSLSSPNKINNGRSISKFLPQRAKIKTLLLISLCRITGPTLRCSLAVAPGNIRSQKSQMITRVTTASLPLLILSNPQPL